MLRLTFPRNLPKLVKNLTVLVVSALVWMHALPLRGSRNHTLLFGNNKRRHILSSGLLSLIPSLCGLGEPPNACHTRRTILSLQQDDLNTGDRTISASVLAKSTLKRAEVFRIFQKLSSGSLRSRASQWAAVFGKKLSVLPHSSLCNRQS